MKRYILSSLVLGASLSLLTGCAVKSVKGVDECGQTYTDTTYRTYDKKCNYGTYIVTETGNNKCNPCKTPPKTCATKKAPKSSPVLTADKPLRINVQGQGVSPTNTISPAQAYALAKRAAIADAYRLIAEKVKGVYVEGEDTIKNMMVERSTVRTSVHAMVRDAKIVETKFKDGLCEVEMEIVLSHSDFAR
jgi:hypothetical protein